MRSFLYFMALILAINYVGAQKPDCKGEPIGLKLSHPKSCSKYYICMFSEAVLKLCPYGLHFDATNSVCALPAQVQNRDCSLRGICLKQEDGYKFPHKSCDKFYLCHHEEAMLKQCKNGLYFDYSDSTCKPPEKINGPCRVPSNICSGKEDGTMIAHTDKTKFYFCYEKTARIVDCNDGLIFNESKQYCQKPGLAKNHVFPCNRKLYGEE